jgi:hypothetical protein
MRIWKLKPVDPADQAWTGYNTKPMLVRAESANKAQDLAQYETLQWRTPTPTPSHKKEFNPWVGYKTRCPSNCRLGSEATISRDHPE